RSARTCGRRGRSRACRVRARPRRRPEGASTCRHPQSRGRWRRAACRAQRGRATLRAPARVRSAHRRARRASTATGAGSSAPRRVYPAALVAPAAAVAWRRRRYGRPQTSLRHISGITADPALWCSLYDPKEDTMQTLDQTRVEAFAGQIATEIGAALNAALVTVGDRLGSHRAMADAKPISAGEPAARTNTHERYVREWLNAQAAGGFMNYDSDEDSYPLPAEHAFILADDSSP